MAKFPNPPSVAQLRSIEPVMMELPTGSLLWRVYFRAGRHPSQWHEFRHFGPVTGRFDHHLADAKGSPVVQERGIFYAALHGPTCFAEVFQSTRIIDRYTRSPWLTGFKTTRPLTFLDLSGTFCTKIGASTAIHSGPRTRAQLWSQAFYEAYPAIEGVLYCSSMYGNAPALALYEMASTALPSHPAFHRSLADPELEVWLRDAASELNYELL